MDTQVGTSRKRTKEATGSNLSEVPSAKKKKLAPKGKEAVQLSQDPSALPLPTPSPSFNTSVNATQEAAESGSSQTVEVAPATPAPKKPAKVAKNRYLKPQRLSPGSWMTHIASLVVHRCVYQAESRGLDPRSHLSDINWGMMLDGLLGPEDLHMIWYFIGREYPNSTLTSVLDSTQPYSDLTLDKLLREEIRLKYKDTIPKPPPTPYMLFSKSKQPKLKQKYPNLPMTEVAMKLGKKWSSMSEEKKERYKQQHAMLRTAYLAQLQSFYEEHPDAKPPPKQPNPSKSKRPVKSTGQVETETEEDKRIKELKAQLPKQPISAYLHFCKKKREKLQRKHPELSPNAVTVKLGKRWQTMDKEARMKYVKLHEAGVLQYKEDMAKFHELHPDAQDLLAKAKKVKRKQKLVSKQLSPATVGEGAEELVQSSSLESSAPLNSAPSLPTTTAAADEKGEGEGEEEQEEDEEEAVDHVNSQQNGPEESDNSDSETDSSGSSED